MLRKMLKQIIKKEEGITLAALTIYIIIFTLLIGVMTTISTFFYNNLGQVVDTPKYVSEFNKFVMFFATDVKNYKEATVTETTIEFEDGPVYQYQNNIIYRDNVAIANYILNCTFTAGQYNVNTLTKNLINVDMQIGKNEQKSLTRNVDFTLRYW